MASGTFTLYSSNKNHINNSDLVGATIKIALVTSSYTPNSNQAGESLWATISTNEIANGNGYTTGGASLASMASNADTTDSPQGYYFTSASPAWTASGGNIPAWRYAVMYVSGSLWGMTNPLVGYFIGDSTPADIPATSSGNTLTLNTPTNGWFKTT